MSVLLRVMHIQPLKWLHSNTGPLETVHVDSSLSLQTKCYWLALLAHLQRRLVYKMAFWNNQIKTNREGTSSLVSSIQNLTSISSGDQQQVVDDTETDRFLDTDYTGWSRVWVPLHKDACDTG